LENNKIRKAEMKKSAQVLCGLLAGIFLNTATQAAPIVYRFDKWFQLSESYSLPDGSSVQRGLGQDLPTLLPVAPLSITFKYDSSVAVIPAELPTTPPGSAYYVEAFDAPGAFTQITGTFGSYDFAVSSARDMGFATIEPSIYPGDVIQRRVGAIGPTTSHEGDYIAVLNGQDFKLAYISMSFYGGPTAGVLPASLPMGLDLNMNVQLLFAGADGTPMNAFYLGRLTEVPLPGAFWLFGSGLLAPIVLRARKNRSQLIVFKAAYPAAIR
jgi:hypothetical protein